MARKSHLFVLPSMVVIFAAVLAWPEDDQASAILKKAADVHRGLQNFEFEAIQVDEFPQSGANKRIESRIMTIARNTSTFRTEQGEPEDSTITISSGTTTWQYIPSRRQFTRKPGGSEERYFSRFAHIADSIKEASLLPGESLEIEGTSIPCYVIRVELPPRSDRVETAFNTYWIDQRRSIVLRELFERHVKSSPFNEPPEIRASTTLTRVRLNQPLNDSLFVFTPPAGVREVDEFLPGRDMTGETAPDFLLNDVDGKPFRLSSTRGKVVLLDFWATWCPPCREAMPVIEKLQHEFKDKDFLVVGVNTNEPANKARDFVEKAGITYTIVMAEGGSVVDEFQAKGLPVMMIIDRDGKIIGHYGGWAGESKLRDRLRSAGVP
jgi:thiol-disulfide isomerase/thioredoxin